jgi:AcrR family transcriptional regulator
MIRLMGDPAQADAPSSRQGGEPAAGRASWGSISREEIVAAAAGIVAAGGYEEMSIRGLAASLGVAPMSLYRHIRDKDDLLGEITDRLLAGAWRPAAAEDDWQAWITEAASRLRDFLVSQPAALHVYLRHPVVSPAAVDRMNAMMNVLRRAGLSEEEARSAYGALHTYTIGFAALEASRAGSAPGTDDASGGDAGRLGRQLAAYTTTGQFITGLRYLLQGISGHAGATGQSGT